MEILDVKVLILLRIGRFLLQMCGVSFLLHYVCTVCMCIERYVAFYFFPCRIMYSRYVVIPAALCHQESLSV